MENVAIKLVDHFISGGPQAVIAILLLVIGALVWDRMRMVAELKRKDERLDQIVDDFHEGHRVLAEALAALRIALIEMRSKW